MKNGIVSRWWPALASFGFNSWLSSVRLSVSGLFLFFITASAGLYTPFYAHADEASEASGDSEASPGEYLSGDGPLSELATVNPPLHQCLAGTYPSEIALSDIATVDCPDAGIKSLGGLEAFSGLQTLDLHNTANSASPNTFANITPLVNESNEPVSELLTSIDFSGLNLQSGSTLFASLNSHLYKLNTVRHLNLSRSDVNQLPAFSGLGNAGMLLQTLNLRDNNLTSLNGLTNLRAVNTLALSGNPLGNSVLESDSALNAFDDMISLSLDNIGLSGVVEARSLPLRLGFLHLKDNPDLTRFSIADTANQRIQFGLDTSTNTSMDCRGLDALYQWFDGQAVQSGYVGDPLLGQEYFTIGTIGSGRAARCTPEAPQGLTVQILSNGTSHVATWLAESPVHWGTQLYKIHYRVIGTQTASVLNAGGTGYYGFELPALADDFYEYAVQACSFDDGQNPVEICGPVSAYSTGIFLPLRPTALQVTGNANNTATIQWQYPAVPTAASHPDEFEIQPLFPVVDPLPAPVAFDSAVNGVWTAAVNNIAEYPAGVVRVVACRGTGAQRDCGPHAEVTVLAGPQMTTEIQPPANPTLNGVPHNGEYQLAWTASTGDVDYYEIEEIANGQPTGRKYAIEETHLAVKRYDNTVENNIAFRLRACRRVRDGNDECSATFNDSPTMTVNTSQHIRAPISVCWYDAGPSQDGLVTLKLKWNYHPNNHVPLDFLIRRVGLDTPLPIVGDLNATFVHDFSRSEYDRSRNKWYWESEVEAYAGVEGETRFTVASRFGNNVRVSSSITPVRWVNDQLQFDTSSQCSEIPPEILSDEPVGGPGNLQPGHFSDDPARRGNGWRFYWANELRYDDVHQTFGISYDLIGFWYTYKLIGGEWSPVWYFTRMQLEQDAQGNYLFEGALIYPRRDLDDQQVGTVKLWFPQAGLPFPIDNVEAPDGSSSNDNQNAWIEVDINHGDGMQGQLSHQIHDIALDHESIFNNPENPNDHYSGVWTTGPLFTDGDAFADHEFFMVDWIENNLLSVGINFFDTNGNPIWLAVNRCEEGCSDSSIPDSYGGWQNFFSGAGVDAPFTVFPGNDPMGTVPDTWGEVSEHHVTASGTAGRRHRTVDTDPELDTDYNESFACINLQVSLPGGRAAVLDTTDASAACNSTRAIPVQKVANQHHIDYNVAGNAAASQCHLSETNPACEIRLTWFTDDDYRDSYPYFRRNGSAIDQPLGDLCNGGDNANDDSINADYVVTDYVCLVDQPGEYTFFLKNRVNEPDLSAAIARSRPLSITGTSPANPGVEPVPDAPITATTAHTLAVTQQHNAQVGALAGQAAASGGAATYQIPINVPPGRQGMQPGVSLSYSSRAGNGPLGMGWSLSVGSSIHRCPKTIAQDGQTIGVRYRNSDRLCLDGQRLMRVNAGDYWADGGIYRTEIDSFIQVELIGTNGGTSGENVRFEVRSKDNRVRHYGNTALSRVKPAGSPTGGSPVVVSSWLISQEADTYGNRVDYLYLTHGDGEHLIDRVLYTGFGDSMGTRQVKFVYDDRCMAGTGCDNSESWSHGYHTEQTRRLTQIRTCVNSQCADGQNGLVREYNFNYHLSSASQRLLLGGVQECAWQNGSKTCLPETEFGWGDEAPAFNWGRWQVDRGNGTMENVIDRDPMVWEPGVIGAGFEPAGDFDGDGTREFQISDGVNRWLVSLNAEGQERWRVGGVPGDDTAELEGSPTPFINQFVNMAEMEAEMVERVARLDGESFATESELQAAEDEVIAAVESEFILKELPASAFSDIDNDGRVDFYGAVEDPQRPESYVLAFSHWKGLGQGGTGGGTMDEYFDLTLTDLPVTVLQSTSPYVVETPIWGDVTGDGLPDALFYTSVQQPVCGTNDGSLQEAGVIELWINQGIDSAGVHRFAQHANGNNGIVYVWPCTFFDEDGDGNPDDDEHLRESASRPSLRDVNGDGVLDIVINSRIPNLTFRDYSLSNVTIGDVTIPTGYQSATLRYLLADVDTAGVNFIEQALWSADGSDLGLASDPRLTWHLPLDVNGDGRDDHVFIANRDDGDTLTNGGWYVQINSGAGYLPPQAVQVPAELAIALKPHPRNLNIQTPNNILVAPQYAALIKPVDWNSDGRSDLLVPRRLDQAICLIRKESAPTGTDNITYGTYCPGNMDGTGPEPTFLNIRDNDRVPPDHDVGGIHYMGFSGRDASTYEMGVVEFVYNESSNTYQFSLTEAGAAQDRIIAGVSSTIADVNGDGIIDIITPFGCQEYPSGSESHNNPNTATACVTETGFFTATAYNFPDVPYSESFHCRYGAGGSDGVDCGPDHADSQRGYYLTRLQQPREQVLDLMLSASDGLNNQAHWHYAPLSSDAPRPGTDIPLYSVPNRELGIDYLRNFESDHFYFTSSMVVVSSLDQSNGLTENLICDQPLAELFGCTVGQSASIPLFNTTYYGYEEAVFNNQGRGFQGFRKVVSEQHVTNPAELPAGAANDLRTVSVFHQVFPLAGQVEATYTQSATLPYDPLQDRVTAVGATQGDFNAPANVLSLTTMDYACRAASGVEYLLCGLDDGDITPAQAFIQGASGHGIYQPIMAASTVTQYEPNSGARYLATRTERDYDAYGNVTQNQVTSRHYDTNGSTELLVHEQTVTAVYRNLTSDWWIGRLDSMVTTSSSRYPGQPVPATSHLPGFGSVTAPKITSQQWSYNTQRRIECEYTVEGGQTLSNPDCSEANRLTVAGGQTTRMLTRYDTYGNSNRLVIDANSLEEQRVAQTTYSNDGYFPFSVTNALGHTVTTVIEPREGNPLEVSDANDLITNSRYDPFGRETHTWYPNSPGISFEQLLNNGQPQHYAPRSQQIYAWADACGTGVPADAVYCQWTVSDGAPVVWQALDSRNRVIQTRSNGFKSTKRIYTAARYNGRGQVVSESVPQYDLVSGVDTAYRYDELGRVIFKSQPSSQNAGALLYTHYQPDGLTTTVHVTASASAPAACVPASPLTVLDNDLCVTRTYAANGWLLQTSDAHGETTTFWHDGQGNAKLIRDPHGNLTGGNYNHLGQRTHLFDPNMGNWNFVYNGLGEVIEQTDAKGQTISFRYDKLGRITSRVAQNPADSELGGIEDRWVYDPLGGDGLLDLEQRRIGLSSGETVTVFNKTYAYDSYTRPAGYELTLQPHYYPTTGLPDTPVLDVPATYRIATEYDRYFARPKSLTYPQERLRLFYAYDSNGHITKEASSNTPDSPYREILAMTETGQVSIESFGNGLVQYNDYHPHTFQMTGTDITDGPPSNTLAGYRYQYDVFDNLVRHDNTQALESETFQYDHLHRLTESNRSNAGSIDYQYDALGNLLEKSDFGSGYTYTSGKPNAVNFVNVGGQSAVYGYDANGNMTSGDSNSSLVGTLRVHYGPYNKPFRTQRNADQSEFWYGSSNQRYYQLDQAGTRTVYVDKLYEQKGHTEHKLYLGDYAVFTVDLVNPDETGITFMHKDRLGSPVQLSDESGALITDAARGFDPFGKPREGSWIDSNNQDGSGPGDTGLPGDLNRPDLTTRGFTGHEQLNNVALTHMNGRAYDYNLGRFLSVDPFIAFPEDSQSLNPYSYLMNSPMAGTDPTGYLPSICGQGKISRCEGGGLAYLKAKNAEDDTYKYEVSFSNGETASITFSVNADGGLNIYDYEAPSGIGAPGEHVLYHFETALACETCESIYNFVTSPERLPLGCETRGGCSVARLIDMRDKGEITQEEFDTVAANNALAAALAVSVYLPTPEEVLILKYGGQLVNALVRLNARRKIFRVGVNITPLSTANKYRIIGKHGRTFVTELPAVEKILGPLKGGRITISRAQARQLERDLGLDPINSPLESRNIISVIDGIRDRYPGSPLTGNKLFEGAGSGLPGGGAEFTIQGIPSAGGQGIRQIILEVGN